jgi:hypothetical protein
MSHGDGTMRPSWQQHAFARLRRLCSTIWTGNEPEAIRLDANADLILGKVHRLKRTSRSGHRLTVHVKISGIY